MSCGICGSDNTDSVIKVKEMMFGLNRIYEYGCCTNCNALQIIHPETDNNFLYPASYYSFNNQSAVPLTNRLKKKIQVAIVKHSIGSKSFVGALFSKWRPNYNAQSLKHIIQKQQKILDVGCGDGSLIQALFHLGYTGAEGIDPYISADINDNGLKIYKKHLHQLEHRETYDLIMFHHSFEHMENPGDVLSEVWRLLKPGGKCMLRIPVADSFAFKKYGANWVQLDAPRHIFLHTNKSISILAAKSGLHVQKIVNDSTTFQFIGSEQYQKGIPLSAPSSYYQPLYKKWMGLSKHIFSKKDLENFERETDKVNRAGEGDQRIFLLSK